MRRSELTEQDLRDRKLLVGFEGGAVYTAERGDKFYVIQDESTMAEFLDDDDLVGLGGELVKVLEFDTQEERASYIEQRGWGRKHRS